MAREKKRPKGKKEEEGLDIDFGMGKVNLGLGGIFNGIEKLVDLSEELKKAGGEVNKQGEIDLSHLKKGMKGVFGFTVKSMAGGESKVEPFGNIKKSPKGPVVDEEREPIVDVFDEKDHILVVAELPGITEESIKTEIKGDILNILAEKGDRKYKKEVLLPSKVESEPISSAYKNGVLEIKLKKQS